MEIKDVIEYGRGYNQAMYFGGGAVTAALLGVFIKVCSTPAAPTCLVVAVLLIIAEVLQVRSAKRRLKERSGFSSIEEYEQAGAPDA